MGWELDSCTSLIVTAATLSPVRHSWQRQCIPTVRPLSPSLAWTLDPYLSKPGNTVSWLDTLCYSIVTTHSTTLNSTSTYHLFTMYIPSIHHVPHCLLPLYTTCSPCTTLPLHTIWLPCTTLPWHTIFPPCTKIFSHSHHVPLCLDPSRSHCAPPQWVFKLSTLLKVQHVTCP